MPRDGLVGVRERHTGTGHLRVSCLLCGWGAGQFATDAGADLAMTAHVEAVHGQTATPHACHP